ncbi:NADH dehydrogenase subunit 6 (mitochondrion) [Chrysochloris asiatica]|uniref:NADH-ubiquinone oxidoreductase chain 6 n=1 Tax=Chrysochloris asiatica TaxID=185453 RepID=Q7Y8I3_CHRAS|nr:NADH dehydrogenase subunit 6 [Chrysochloris asiatica]BAC78423.1 NADH dehydrogenase subunit 6 [Chrysochloris asiatica]
MVYLLFMLSVMLVVGFISFSSKPSPVYGGLGLIVSGGLGCGIVVYYGGSFLGLMVFLVYLGGMLVVFGYTTAMATEEYPEAWGSNMVIMMAMIIGVLMELVVVVLLVGGFGGNYVCDFVGSIDWSIYSIEDLNLVREDYVGASSLYNYGSWMMIMAGWALFVSVFIVIEITRGR